MEKEIRAKNKARLFGAAYGQVGSVFQYIALLERIALEVTTMGLEEVTLDNKVIDANGKGIVKIKVTTYDNPTDHNVFGESINKYISFYDKNDKPLVINDEINTLTKVLQRLQKENTIIPQRTATRETGTAAYLQGIEAEKQQINISTLLNSTDNATTI